MNTVKYLLDSILEEIDNVVTKLDLKKVIDKNDLERQKIEPKEPNKLEKNSILRKLEEIEKGTGSIEELKKLIKDKKEK